MEGVDSLVYHTTIRAADALARTRYARQNIPMIPRFINGEHSSSSGGISGPEAYRIHIITKTTKSVNASRRMRVACTSNG